MLSRAARAAWKTPVSTRGLATVAENTINCTFILGKQKKRVTVPGMVGWTLLDTAKHHRLPVHGCASDALWDYYTFGDGPSSIEDHVVISKEFTDIVGPPQEQELTLLTVSDYENLTPTSRLAACIKLTKEMDGLVVLVPETNPDLTKYA
mmetsp:Transcript_63635/g.105811  ORF Transcript_63635/g.105811 Transcript_63635/m.105811 type:complete len:150 (-) Transcript_63635:369-818(-)|eukprot:CAMPEP_0119339988 /NCGR_PEP_ID=MMETSP1333-20130426/99454_1 /TAXON_ID=418940 /ORGANISM="Scyphosphaera apsteinii, Strain RCC1455" /LENGTH=149 /DNA_ID=CAMNT_0007351627 /DNA_START=19 /DNA_END=468 /DNA_ORIENTATION=-